MRFEKGLYHVLISYAIYKSGFRGVRGGQRDFLVDKREVCLRVFWHPNGFALIVGWVKVFYVLF